ncbi:trimeric intracellular cation channel family protein [Aestuariivirga sp.]|uniref:trimeric intracellular cation channel family protein n=1 Tax=Aestuariivirga sp. TaxID=2650926 RepID=UPI003919F27F
MLQTITSYLDWFGVCVFAVTGALVASRKQMDIVGFALMGSVTGIGGGTIRDVLLGLTPVFWVQKPSYLITCISVSVATFLVAGFMQSRYRYLLWFDAVGLALFAVTGASTALQHGAGATIAIAMGVATATFGGIIRDIMGGESPVILSREIYITAALLGAGVYVSLVVIGTSQDAAIVAGFICGFGLRSAALMWQLSLPRYRPATDRNPE